MPRKTELLKTSIAQAAEHYDQSRSDLAKETLEIVTTSALVEIADTLKDILSQLTKLNTPRGK